MEKIKISLKQDTIYFLSGYIGICIVLFLKNYLIVAAPLFLIALLMFVLISVLNYLQYSSIIFSDKGINLNSYFVQYEIINWNDLKIELIKNNKDQVDIFLKNKTIKKRLTIDYVTRDSVFDLTKKYCPKDHELYKIVEEYAQKEIFRFN